jgi:hypothetical protein
MEEDPIKV